MEQSIANLKRAFALNPLSTLWADNVGYTCGLIRDLDQANRYYDIAIRLSPDRPGLYAIKTQIILRLAGDIAQARAVIESARRLRLENSLSMAYSRVLVDLYDGTIQESIKRLSSESWEALESRASYVPKALLQAQLYGLARQPQLEKSFYESAVKMIMAKIQQKPDEAFYHSSLGIAYAGLGQKQNAIREGQAGVDMKPVSQDAVDGFSRLENLAQIYAMVDEYDKALRLLEQLMSIPGDLGLGALRLDPAWKPLRDHPRFQALLRKYGG
jgi:tetratricopeptide (TPR) repeat protein